MPPGCEVAMATGDRERSGRYVLAGRPPVIEQDKQDWLSVHIDRRLSQSLRQVRAPHRNPQLGGHDTARAWALTPM
jgi:hypothetical protein